MRRLQNALERVPPAAWLIVAAASRLILAGVLGDRFYQSDEPRFDASAWTLAHEGLRGLDGQVPPPVPTAFFGAFYVVFGHHPLFARLGQALVSAATAWMIGAMTEELSGSVRAGRFAFAVAAVYPFFIYYSGILMSETLYVAAVVPGLWLLCASLEKPSPDWRPALAGFCLGLAALARVEAIAATLVIGLVAALACAVRRWSWRAWALTALCWALPLAGASMRNKAATGHFSLDNHGGLTLLVGTMYYELTEATDTGVAMDAIKRSPLYAQAEKLDSKESDRLFMRASLDFMREHPGQTLRQWCLKFLSFWRFYPRVDKAYIENDSSHPGMGMSRVILVAVSLLFEPALILLGFAGLWRLRARWRTLWPLGVFIAGTTSVHVVVVSMMRYRLPVMPFLILGAAAFASRESSAQPR